MKSGGKQYISDETARFTALCMVFTSLNAFGFTIFFYEPPSTMRDIVIALMGSLTTIFVQQVQYYNKTGVGNDRMKDETLNKMVATAASLQAQTSPTEATVTLEPGQSATVAAAPDNPINGTVQDPKSE